MKPSTKDQAQGKFHEAKGAIKEKTGSMIGNPELAARGHDEKVRGKMQNKVGQSEKTLGK
jgi:uncharacterized protein YjbJ (UPF0337 family)